MSQDWIDDPNLSSEEKLARFRALGPEPTRGPSSLVTVFTPTLTGVDAQERLTLNRTIAGVTVRVAQPA